MNTLDLPGKYEIKELQKPAMLGTAHNLKSTDASK